MISGLGKLDSLGALQAVQPCLEKKTLAKEAEAAVVRLAEAVARKKDRKAHAALVKILDEVTPRFQDKESTKKAVKIAGKLKKAMARER